MTFTNLFTQTASDMEYLGEQGTPDNFATMHQEKINHLMVAFDSQCYRPLDDHEEPPYETFSEYMSSIASIRKSFQNAIQSHESPSPEALVDNLTKIFDSGYVVLTSLKKDDKLVDMFYATAAMTSVRLLVQEYMSNIFYTNLERAIDEIQ